MCICPAHCGFLAPGSGMGLILIIFLGFFAAPVSQGGPLCARNECMSTSGQCLTVNQTNQVCRDVGGACREAGQRWNHTTCFMVECRGPRISVVSDNCVNSDGECVSMDSENQLCRDQKGNCRSHGSRWRYKCYKVSCQNNRVEIINAKCCVKDSKGCVRPLDCRSPGEIWTVPGEGTLQSCNVTIDDKGHHNFRYFSPLI